MTTYRGTTLLVALQLIGSLTMGVTESVKMPAECKDMDYCIYKGNDYPDKEVMKLNDMKQLPQMLLKTGGTYDYGHRQGDDFTSIMCPAQLNTTLVYYIVDTDHNTRVVVQLPDIFKQEFTLQKCVKPGVVQKAAGGVLERHIKEFSLYCKDIYYHFEFYVLSLDGTRLEKAYSRRGLPVSCACRYDIGKHTH